MAADRLAGMVGAIALLVTGAAQADVTISKRPTQNMSCQSDVCSPTAPDAVLNATDLTNMLSSGDVKVTTGTVTNDIELHAALSWASTSRLTLDAQRSVVLKKPMTVTGTGTLTVTTNDGGKNGEFVILPEKGSVQFWDLNSSLVIDGQSYTLIGDIKTLATAVAANPSGFYALAKPYDASVDGPYTSSAITTEFEGAFEGLGNTIANLQIHGGQTTLEGFFAFIRGSVENFGLTDADFEGPVQYVGILSGANAGEVTRTWATGAINFSNGPQFLGGLTGGNTTSGTVSGSFADVQIRIDQALSSNGGGLVGENAGEISASYARGSIAYRNASNTHIGGLAGNNIGRIEDVYSRISLHNGPHNCCETYVGGLVGQNYRRGRIKRSYAAGIFRERKSDTQDGGLIGHDSADHGHIESSYWDLDTGISDPEQGAGNRKNDPGITLLTTEQLRSGLPPGFDPKIWGVDPRINGGYPYLLALPPH